MKPAARKAWKQADKFSLPYLAVRILSVLVGGYAAPTDYINSTKSANVKGLCHFFLFR